MKKVCQNTGGYAHPIIFVVVIAGVVGLIGFSGHRVWVKSSFAKRNNATSLSPRSNETPAVTEATETKTVTVNKTGTAATAVKQTSSSAPKVAEQIQVTTKYDIKTPEGSLNQLIHELKTYNFSNALYFITPRFMVQASKVLDVVEPVSLDQCKANETCKMLLSTDIGTISTNTIKPYSSPSVSAEGKSLVFTMLMKDGKLISQYPGSAGEYQITIDMLNVGTNWVVDRATINGYTL